LYYLAGPLIRFTHQEYRKIMGAFRITVFAVACVLMLSTSACSSSEHVASSPAVNSPDGLTDAEMEEIFNARQAEGRSKYIQADVDFMTGMISHHAQALVMADMAPSHGASSKIQTLCARIINAQNDEIAKMQQWLRIRDETVPEVHIDGTTLMVHGGGDHAMSMPGMLTQEQIDELDASRGADFDRLFLTYMIQHHKGAISMVDAMLAIDGSGQDEASFKLASDIYADQDTEIKRMQGMLEQYSGSDQNP
jgi:uncharacterized protein (DUF305 family)